MENLPVPGSSPRGGAETGARSGAINPLNWILHNQYPLETLLLSAINPITRHNSTRYVADKSSRPCMPGLDPAFVTRCKGESQATAVQTVAGRRIAAAQPPPPPPPPRLPNSQPPFDSYLLHAHISSPGTVDAQSGTYKHIIAWVMDDV